MRAVITALGLWASATLLQPLAAEAQDSERPPRHERAEQTTSSEPAYTASFARLTLAVGHNAVTTKLPVGQQFGEVVFDGFEWGFCGDLGAAIMQNLILHVRALLTVLAEPHGSVDGRDVGRTRNTSLTTAALAPALTYYVFAPYLYVTGSIGVATVLMSVMQAEQLQASTDLGLWMNLDVGVEGWIGKRWSAGIAGRLMHALIPGGDGSDVRLLGLGLVLSLTGEPFGS